MALKLTATQALKSAKELSFEGLREAFAWRQKPTKLPAHRLVRGPPPKAFFRRGDTVEVVDGPEKGKQGSVYKVLRYDQNLLVRGVNMETITEEHFDVENNLKTSQYEKMRPIPFSAVRLIDPDELKPTEISHNSRGQRISVLTGKPLPSNKTIHTHGPGPLDTPAEKYQQRTFTMEDPWTPPFPSELTR